MRSSDAVCSPRVEHLASDGEVCIVLAGSDIGGWLTDVIALTDRSPSVRLVVAPVR